MTSCREKRWDVLLETLRVLIQPTAQKRRSSRMSRASFSARVHHAAMLGEE